MQLCVAISASSSVPRTSSKTVEETLARAVAALALTVAAGTQVDVELEDAEPSPLCMPNAGGLP
ncbi:MAG: hypothetical protein GY938_00695 [Ketobacter sp.]|nr:hypothetical protein [Ketobacter sp.]